MKEPRLKPCPFCGAPGAIREPTQDVKDYAKQHRTGLSFWCYCTGKNRCRILPYTEIYATKHGAITAWNRRAKDGATRIIESEPDPAMWRDVSQALAHLREMAEENKRLKATIDDVMSALGNEVRFEGPRLAAMRVHGERDDLKATLARYAPLIEAVEKADVDTIKLAVEVVSDYWGDGLYEAQVNNILAAALKVKEAPDGKA